MNDSFEKYLSLEPYSLDRATKSRLLSKRIRELTEHHVRACPEYAGMMRAVGFLDRAKAERLVDDVGNVLTYEDIPFLPVRLFKELSLKSVPDGEIIKTMTSSGTTGQAVSKIYLDKTTASNQQKVMAKIVADFTGQGRMPMLIIDCPSTVKDRRKFSARAAGILGFSIFGRDKCYCLKDEDMSLDVDGLTAFLAKHRGEKILLFGFTFMVWQHFYRELMRLKGDGMAFDLSQGIVIHGGGWKKLVDEAVTSAVFKESLHKVCGIKAENVHDYYGMVEQTGCIYMECECGHLHASIFSDVLVRNPKDFSLCDEGESGIIEVVSTLPESYPGHCLLTEDIGVVLGEDDCPCGRKGKYFRVQGRLQNAELRGCSDTYGAGFKA